MLLVLSHCVDGHGERATHNLQRKWRQHCRRMWGPVCWPSTTATLYSNTPTVWQTSSKNGCTPETNFPHGQRFEAVHGGSASCCLSTAASSRSTTRSTKFFPGFPEYGRKITVKHLLTHTSGLPAYEELIPKGTTLQLDDLDVLHLLMDTKEPRFAAGEKFEYSNSGYTLLGLIVEVAAQKPFHEFMASEIFRPLGMNDSVLYQRGLNEFRIARSATSGRTANGCAPTKA